jgi:hypothetical protein
MLADPYGEAKCRGRFQITRHQFCLKRPRITSAREYVCRSHGCSIPLRRSWGSHNQRLTLDRNAAAERFKCSATRLRQFCSLVPGASTSLKNVHRAARSGRGDCGMCTDDKRVTAQATPKSPPNSAPSTGSLAVRLASCLHTSLTRRKT